MWKITGPPVCVQFETGFPEVPITKYTEFFCVFGQTTDKGSSPPTVLPRQATLSHLSHQRVLRLVPKAGVKGGG